MSTRRRIVLAAGVVAWATLAEVSGAGGAGGPRPSQVPTLKAHTDLVVLHVAVLDRHSRFVSALPQDQFRIYEDGVPQTIRFFSNEDRAATIGLVIDNSGSMYRKLDDVIAAGRVFVDGSNPLDEFFVVHFNDRVWLNPEGDTSFTTDPLVLATALSHIEARGRTALYDAVTRGFQHLNHAHNPHRVLVVVSDGGDNASAARFDQLLRDAHQTDTVIYTIGLFDEDSRDRNPRVLRALAAATGGEAFLSGSVHGAMAVLERIAHDIRSTYMIGYEPTNASRDGRFRNVRVELNATGHGKLKVRARTGYVVPAASHEGQLQDGQLQNGR
jgi:VWFA-related protein